MSSDDDDMDYLTDEATKSASAHDKPAIPQLSKAKYNYVYETFHKWNKKKGAKTITEDVMIKFFTEFSEKYKPNTLWAYYSMIKSTLRLKDNFDISPYSKLLEFLKGKSAEHKPIKAKVFTEVEIEKFLNEAPDEQWLDLKVAAIFGVNGACSTIKLVNIKFDNIKQYDDLILVTLPGTESSAKSSFTIAGTFVNFVQKYITLRPKNIQEDNFFLHFRDGKCTTQRIGKVKFSQMPRRIAKYLKLPEPERYSGFSFRMNQVNTSTSNGYFSANIGTEQRIDNSLGNAPLGLLQAPSDNHTSHFVPTPSGSSDNNAYSNTIQDHGCTISCAQVQCAKEEYGTKVFHAFNIMKPPEFTIIEVTSAVFPADPMCRWIVAYTHINEPVTPLNADEAFEDITRSIPNNVRVNEKYIRGNSSRVLAAYVVVYGVKCHCLAQQQPLDIFQ